MLINTNNYNVFPNDRQFIHIQWLSFDSLTGLTNSKKRESLYTAQSQTSLASINPLRFGFLLRFPCKILSTNNQKFIRSRRFTMYKETKSHVTMYHLKEPVKQNPLYQHFARKNPLPRSSYTGSITEWAVGEIKLVRRRTRWNCIRSPAAVSRVPRGRPDNLNAAWNFNTGIHEHDHPFKANDTVHSINFIVPKTTASGILIRRRNVSIPSSLDPNCQNRFRWNTDVVEITCTECSLNVNPRRPGAHYNVPCFTTSIFDKILKLRWATIMQLSG